MVLAQVVICSGYPTQIAVIALLGFGGWLPMGVSGTLTIAYVFTVSLLDAVLLIGLVLLFLNADGERPSAVLFGGRRSSREMLVGTLLTPVAFLIAIAVLAAARLWAPWLHNVPNNPLEELIGTHGDAILLGIVAVLAGGLREEVQRAFVLSRFEQHLGGAIPGLIVFSVAFGAGHIIQGYDAALATGLLGAFWGVVYLVRRSILAPMVSHSLFNITEIVFQV